MIRIVYRWVHYCLPKVILGNSVLDTGYCWNAPPLKWNIKELVKKYLKKKIKKKIINKKKFFLKKLKKIKKIKKNIIKLIDY